VEAPLTVKNGRLLYMEIGDTERKDEAFLRSWILPSYSFT